MKTLFSKQLTADNFTNLIAPKTHITGSIGYDGVLKIQGRVNGDIIKGADSSTQDGEYTIIVDNGAHVTSDSVWAKNAIIKGQLFSKCLHVENTLRIHKTAMLQCVKIFYRVLEIEPGALVHNCELIHIDHVPKAENEPERKEQEQ